MRCKKVKKVDDFKNTNFNKNKRENKKNLKEYVYCSKCRIQKENYKKINEFIPLTFSKSAKRIVNKYKYFTEKDIIDIIIKQKKKCIYCNNEVSSRESKHYGKMRNIEIDRNNSNEFIICCLMCKKLKEDDYDFNEFNIMI